MKKILSLLVVLGLTFSFAACGDDAADTKDAEQPAPATEQAEHAAQPESTDDGSALGDYTVVLSEAAQATDMEDGNAILVAYDFTNNGTDAISPAVAVYVQAFQDGVELQDAYFMDYPSADWETWSNNEMLDIQSGASVKTAAGFKLTSTSPVEVQVTELISFSDKKITKTYEVQ